MKVARFNDRLERVQIGRDKEVPIENNNSLWIIWVKKDLEWDSDTISNWTLFIDDLKEAKLIFCIWHGQYRTNLFLMNKEDLIKRLMKFRK